MSGAEQVPKRSTSFTRAPGLDSDRDHTKTIRDEPSRDESVKEPTRERVGRPDRSNDNCRKGEFANHEGDSVDPAVGLNAPDHWGSLRMAPGFGRAVMLPYGPDPCVIRWATQFRLGGKYQMAKRENGALLTVQ